MNLIIQSQLFAMLLSVPMGAQAHNENYPHAAWYKSQVINIKDTGREVCFFIDKEGI